jgi:DNA-binding GntR family transcriptional regulator
MQFIDVEPMTRPKVAQSPTAPGPSSRLTDRTRRAYEGVRQALLDGTLEPGRPISQVRLAAQLDVSRTPLREALRLLETEGLVESDFNRRVQAKPLTMADLEALTAMRILSEPFGVLLTVPTLDPDGLAEMRTDMEKLHAAGERGVDLATIAPLHRRFHFALFGGAGSRLRRHIEDLWDQGERYRHIYLSAASESETLLLSTKREHELILDAAEARNAQLCSRLLAEHIVRAALTVVQQVDVTYDPAIIRRGLSFVSDGLLSG